MFVTLSIRKPQKTRRKRNCGSVCGVARIPLPGAVSFYHMTVQAPSDALPWEKIAEAAGSLRCRMLLPQGVEPPADSGVHAFRPKALPLILLCNTAVAVLEQHAKRAQEITVFDPNGVLCKRLGALVPFASVLRVLTNRPQRYTDTQQKLLRSYGISLCVCAPTAPIPEHGILISCGTQRVPRLFDGLLFTTERRSFLHAKVVAGTKLLLPPELERLRPADIEPLLFSSALYECCGMQSLQTLRFGTH